MRLALLTSDSPAQRALADRFAATEGVELAGILVQNMRGTRTAGWVRRTGIRHPVRLLSKVAQRTILARPLREILRAEGDRFGDRPWTDVPITTVDDVNGAAAVAFVGRLRPDVIAVSGTKIVRQPIFDLAPPLGLLNLHTGISPFVKGGPNCTLWCLANGEPHLIGATVHELDPGIDSGPIVVTAQLLIAGDETPGNLVSGTMALGHDLYADVVAALARGERLAAVPQAGLGPSRTYFTREWNAARLARALWYVRSGALRRWVAAGSPGSDDVRLVPLRTGGS